MLAILILSSVTVLAAGNEQGGSRPGCGPAGRVSATRFSVVGEVVGYDHDDGVITLRPLEGNWMIKPLVSAGEQIEIRVDEKGTRIREYGAPPGVVVPPAEWVALLQPGLLISTAGNKTADGFEAARVTVNVPYAGEL